MDKISVAQLQSRFGSENLHFVTGAGGFIYAELTNKFGQAAVSLYGGHVTSYIPFGEEPVIWMSEASMYKAGEPIRGGIPVCWPWFGPDPAGKFGGHGFARVSQWEVAKSENAPSGESSITLVLTDKAVDKKFAPMPFKLELTVTLGAALSAALKICNTGSADLSYSGALHTYFAVKEAADIQVEGVEDCDYLDKVIDSEDIQNGPVIIDREIDRVYCNTSGNCRIVDPGLKRAIKVAKSGSNSTVIWNPWIEKSKKMPDFGNEEYHTMVCVECANVPAAGDGRTLVPGAMAELRQMIAVEKL